MLHCRLLVSTQLESLSVRESAVQSASESVAAAQHRLDADNSRLAAAWAELKAAREADQDRAGLIAQLEVTLPATTSVILMYSIMSYLVRFVHTYRYCC